MNDPCAEHKGEKMKEIDITAVVENLQTVLDFVDEQLEAKDCPQHL